MAKKFAAMLLLFGSVLARGDPGISQSVSLEGPWSGGGPVTFASGLREQARCRAHYRRRSNDGYVVTTVCATASARAEQTATLRKIGDNKYTGSFYNSEYSISGVIDIVVRGASQTVRLLSESGSAVINLSR